MIITKALKDGESFFKFATFSDDIYQKKRFLGPFSKSKYEMLSVRASQICSKGENGNTHKKQDLLLKAYGNTRVNWIHATFQATGKVFR